MTSMLYMNDQVLKRKLNYSNNVIDFKIKYLIILSEIFLVLLSIL